MSFSSQPARALLVAFACLAAISGLAEPAHAAACPGGDVVKSAAVAFIRAAKSRSPASFSSALARFTDVNGVAMFALGKFRSKLPAARRSEYLTNTRRYMSEFLADHAGRFGGSNLAIASCSGNLVQTSLDGGSGMTWKVAGGRIQDVRVSGIWLALQLRQNFTGIIRRNHGDIDALLDYLAQNATPDPQPKRN